MAIYTSAIIQNLDTELNEVGGRENSKCSSDFVRIANLITYVNSHISKFKRVPGMINDEKSEAFLIPTAMRPLLDTIVVFDDTYSMDAIRLNVPLVEEVTRVVDFNLGSETFAGAVKHIANKMYYSDLPSFKISDHSPVMTLKEALASPQRLVWYDKSNDTGWVLEGFAYSSDVILLDMSKVPLPYQTDSGYMNRFNVSNYRQNITNRFCKPDTKK